MHIAEGVLSPPILVGGAILTTIGVVRGLRSMDADTLPRAGVMAAALFVASLVHVPVGVGSAHLILNGLAGLLLGWAVFPALLVALFLEAILFQFGGLTTLGVNTATMALPGLLCYLAFGPFVRRWGATGLVAPFSAGALAVALSGVMVAASLFASGEAFGTTAFLLLAAHVPIMIVEGLICAFCVAFLRVVKPQMLLGVGLRPELVHAR